MSEYSLSLTRKVADFYRLGTGLPEFPERPASEFPVLATRRLLALQDRDETDLRKAAELIESPLKT
jgi:hypothetical protein